MIGRLRSAFTLIELLVVIATIAVLLALVMPAVMAARESARRARCQGNLRQIGVALASYHESCRAFPPAVIGTAASDKLTTWLVLILSEMGESSLSDSYNFDVRFDDPANSTSVATVVASYLCPSSTEGEWAGPPFAPGNYGANSGTEPAVADGVLFPGSRVRLGDITDGSSKTVAVGEIFFHNLGWARGAASGVGGGGGGGGAGAAFARGVSRWWRCASPCSIPGFNPWRSGCLNRCEQRFQFSSAHAGGTHFAFADGRAAFLGNGMDADVFRRLLTRAGGEPVDD